MFFNNVTENKNYIFSFSTYFIKFYSNNDICYCYFIIANLFLIINNEKYEQYGYKNIIKCSSKIKIQLKNISCVELLFISSCSSIFIDNSLFKLSKEKLYIKDFKRSKTYAIINFLIIFFVLFNNYFDNSLLFVNNNYIFIIALNINKIARREEKRREAIIISRGRRREMICPVAKMAFLS